MAISIYPPAPAPIADQQNQLRVTREWLLFFQQIASGTFGTVHITGDGTVTAGSGSDTLNLTPGDGILITSNPATNTITITADGGRFVNDFLLMGG